MDDERENDGEVDKLAHQVEVAEYKLRIAELEFEVLREKQANRVWAERYSRFSQEHEHLERQVHQLTKKVEYRKNWSLILTQEIKRLREVLKRSTFDFDEKPVVLCPHGIIVFNGAVAICDECREKY